MIVWKLNSVAGWTALIISDTILAYGLESLKMSIKFLVCNEFSLKFAEEFSFSQLHLAIAGVLTILLAGITDSLIGKFFTSIIGLLCIIVSASCVVSMAWLEISTDILFMIATISFAIYTSASAIRDILILEQVKLTERRRNLRQYVFCLVYLKIVVRVFCQILQFTHQIITNKINAIIMLVIFVIYFFWFIIFLSSSFYLESVYLGIWFECVKCVLRAMNTMLTGRRPQGHRPSRWSGDVQVYKRESQETYPIDIQEPLANKSCWGIRCITKENVRTQVSEIWPSPSPEKLAEPESSKWFFHSWYKHWQDHKKPSKKETIIFDAPMFEYEGYQDPFSRSFKEHWLHGARPKTSEYVIYQTARVFEHIPVVVAGSLFSMIDYYLSAFTLLQANISRRSNTYLYNVITPSEFSLGFDLLLFPIFHFCLFPLLRRTFKRDGLFFAIGYLLVCIACVIMLGVQGKAVVGQKFVPGPRSGQIRFYNGLEHKTLLTASWLNRAIQIPPQNYVLIPDIHMSRSVEWREIHVQCKELSISGNATIKLMAGRTMSHISILDRDKKSLVIPKQLKPDITAYGLRNDTFVQYTVVSAINVNLTEFELKFLESVFTTGKFIHQRLSQSGDTHTIEPGTYNVAITFGALGTYTFAITKPVVFERWGVYSLFLYFGAKQRSYEGAFFLLEGPAGIPYSLLLIQLFIASLGRAFATVPFYMFLYLESPEKLRATLMSAVLFLNLTWFTILDPPLFHDQTHGKHMTFMILFVFVQGFMFLLTYFFNHRFKHRFSRL